MKIVKGFSLVLVFLFPIVILFVGLYFFWLGCAIGGISDNFPCRVIFPISCLLGLLAVLVAFKLGFLISNKKPASRWILFYIILITFPLISYFMYKILPFNVRESTFNAKNENSCDVWKGEAKDECLLNIFESQFAYGKINISSCNKIANERMKTRCLIDAKSFLGDGSMCNKINPQYSSTYHTYGTEEASVEERKECYHRATFALKNKYMNSRDFNTKYSEQQCSEEPRFIVKEYCNFLSNRCESISDSIIKKDCFSYRKLYY